MPRKSSYWTAKISLICIFVVFIGCIPVNKNNNSTDEKGDIINIEKEEVKTKIEDIKFEDENLKKCILKSGKKYIEDIVELSCDYHDIKNLSGIENLVNIEGLGIATKSGISNINLISLLTKLVTLHASYCFIDDIEFLASLKNLETLIIGGNNIKDISVLKNFSKLSDLTIVHNKIEDTSVFRDLQNLKFLYISNNLIKDYSVLGELKNLKELVVDKEFLESEEGKAIKKKILENQPACKIRWQPY